MSRRNTLVAIFALHEEWAADFTFVCGKGCATCCTRSVTMTTLEGELIIDHLTSQRPELLPLLATLPRDCPAPAATTNQFAAACLRSEEMAEDCGAWDLAPCSFLQEGCCAIYPARPFMCRSFGSRVRCDLQGAAEVEPLSLSLNTIIMQCIEHLDRGRPWGNLNTILREIGIGDGQGQAKSGTQLLSQPLPGFLLLPEEEVVLRGQMQVLLDLLRGK